MGSESVLMMVVTDALPFHPCHSSEIDRVDRKVFSEERYLFHLVHLFLIDHIAEELTVVGNR